MAVAIAMATHRVAMQDLESEAAQVFYEVAGDMVDMPFGVAKEAEVFEAYGLSADTVCLFKKVRGWRGGGGAILPPHQPSPALAPAVR